VALVGRLAGVRELPRVAVLRDGPPFFGVALERALVWDAGRVVVLRGRDFASGAALFRDPGGEDVRVAMTLNLGDRHTSLMDHSGRVADRFATSR